MPAEHHPDLPRNSLTFALHLVQLSGKPSLLGAECVTWRFTGEGLNIVAGGNGSGKSLLCSAVLAAAFPESTDELRRGLFAAGLKSVTIVGQYGDSRKEWMLDLETGEVIHRPKLTDDQSSQGIPIAQLVFPENHSSLRLPHIVVNGDWRLPEQAQLEWAGSMLAVPLARELAGWEARLDSLSHGEGNNNLESLGSEIAEIDKELARAQSLRESLQQAVQHASELQGRITDSELAIQIATVEETELVGKIEIAERAVHLESWAAELRSSWNEVETTRSQFATLNDQLESLQEITRNLPENIEEIAHEYLTLQYEREKLAARLKENEQKANELSDRRDGVIREQEKIQSSQSGDGTARIASLRARVLELERELTELSRKRIDLLRRRDGLEQQRNEKYRELTLLGPEEWTALELFLSSSENNHTTSQRIEADKRNAEFGRITERLKKEFIGFEKLSSDTPKRLEKLFMLRESVSKREADLALLRSKVVEQQAHGRGTGLKVVLAIIGAASAGVPGGLILGWDIGFFAAVLGGGLGFGIGHMLTPKSEVSHEELVRKIESLQVEQQEALSVREALRLELTPFAEQLQLDSALGRWQEFLRLKERLRTLESALAEQPVAEQNDDHVPSVLRKLEREDIRRRVSEYRVLTSELTDATVELSAFDHPEGPSARKVHAESEALQLRETIATLEAQANAEREEREQKIQALSQELSRIEQELSSVPDVAADRSALRDLLVKIESLDESVGLAFSQIGADSILQALSQRNELQNELRETKSKLSTDHSPQELGIRTSLIEEELRQVTEHLQGIDPLFGTFGTLQDGLEKYRTQMESLFQQRSENEKLISELTAQIHALRLPELKGEIDSLPSDQTLIHNRAASQYKLDELQRSIQTAHKMCDALSAEKAELIENSTSRVHAILQSIVFEAVGERFASVERANDTWFVITDDGQRRPLGTLSRGIAELVTLCLNAGLLSASSEAERAPVLWDDVLSQLDDYHLSIARQVVERLAKERQIVLLTRDPRIRAWGKTVEVLAGHYQLDALVN